MDIARRLVPAAIRRRYAVKFGIALLILGLSVGLIGFVATAELTSGVEDRVEEDQTAFASQEAQGLQMWTEQNERTIGVMARSDAVASDDPAVIEDRLLEWQEHLADDTFAISYVDLEAETVLASTDSTLRERSLADLEGVDETAYAEATEDVPWTSSPYVTDGELDEEAAVITYVLAVPDVEDRAIVYTAELESHDLDTPDGVTTVVVDGDNEIVLDNAGYLDEYETLGLEYDDASIVDDARTDGATTRQVAAGTASVLDVYDFPSEEYVVSAARVHGTDWVVLTHEPESQAFGFVHTVNEWGMYATAAGVLLIGLFGAVLGRNTAVSIDRLTRKAAEIEEGNLDVDLETKRIDNIGRLYDGFDSMRLALRRQIEEAETAREEAERERERIAEINDHLQRTAAEYSDVMKAAADGDLTARMAADGENEAMDAIAAEFNAMLEEIERTVAELSRFATDVATASEQVTASTEEVQSASERVTESVQEISDGAERQNQSLQSVTQEMSGLSTTTEEIAASSNEVADIASRTVETGTEGQAAAQEAITAMERIEGEAEDAVAEMRRLEAEVQQIDELIATISEIARQTNMLALNANIEASRSASGEDEEGFAVVAKEVKALSEDVANAADEAEHRLEAIRERTEQSTAEVEGTSEDIEDAGGRVEEAVEALEEIADLARETNVGVQEISAATEEQAASTEEVVAMVDDASTVSEETTSEAETVAAAAEEQTSALTQVTKSASDLSSQSSQLSAGLDRFETDVPGESVRESTPDAVDLESESTELEETVDALESASTDEPGDSTEPDDTAEPAASPPEGGITFESGGHEPADDASDPLEADPLGAEPSATDSDSTEPTWAEAETGEESAAESDEAADPLAADPIDQAAEESADTGDGTATADPLAEPTAVADDTGESADPLESDIGLESNDEAVEGDDGTAELDGEAAELDNEAAEADDGAAETDHDSTEDGDEAAESDDDADHDGDESVTEGVFTFGEESDDE